MLQVYSTKSANDRIPVLREDEVYLRSHIRNRGELFTAREIEILHWIARGKSDWEIGEILQISAKTVNFHVENSKRKFRCRRAFKRSFWPFAGTPSTTEQ